MCVCVCCALVGLNNKKEHTFRASRVSFIRSPVLDFLATLLACPIHYITKL